MRLLANAARLALRAIRRNKVRSALTILGVIIGVASVIAMVALGSGARSAIDSQIASQGTDVVFVSAGSHGRGGVRGGAGSVNTLTMEDAQAIVARVQTVARMSPVVRGRAQVIAGNENWNTSVEGANPDYLAIRNWTVARGAIFTARDVLTADKVCLLGDTVARTLYGDQDPVGQVIRIRNLPFRVIGVLAPKGQGQWGQDQDDFVLAPYTTIQKKLLGITTIHQVIMSATGPQAVEPTAQAVTELMRERHRTTGPEDDDFMVRTVEEMASARVEMAQTMTVLLMSVASVSLLVGGIGIMNIMLVSVTERTREIGLRLAVGARTRDVLAQFLLEAVTLSLVGGVAGVVLGVVVSGIIVRALGWPAQVTSGAVAVAFVFAGLVGVFFGFYPARKAADLDPIEALRYE